MKRGIFAVAVWVLMLVTPAVAAQKSPKAGHAKPTAAAKPVVKSPAAAKPSTKVHAKTSVKVHAKSQPKTSAKSTAKTNVKTKTSVKTNTKVAKSSKTAAATTTTASTTTVSTPSTSNSTPTETLSPVQQKLKRNTNLADKLQGRLPVGTDLMKAAAGFRNLGQFVAAVNASHNQGLSFIELKRRMVVEGMSLGQAKKDLQRTTTTSPTTTTTVRR